MSLADFFSPEQRLEFFSRNFHAGQVFYLFCGFTTPPKDKYLLLACVNPLPLFLVINSEINDFKLKRTHLRERQVLIKTEDYTFLNHDSYIDCTEAKDSLSQEEVERQVLTDSTRIKGNANLDTIKNVVDSINAARTVALRHKIWMLAELNSL